MKVPQRAAAAVFLTIILLSVPAAGADTVFSDIRLRAVLNAPTGPVPLTWRAVGEERTPSGDSVVSGYFYADPADYAYGSPFNPEVFVKLYNAANGWTNIAFNHVTVDDVDVYSACEEGDGAEQSSKIHLNQRLAEHQYTGIHPTDADMERLSASAAPGYIASDGYYTLLSGFLAKAILHAPAGDVILVWQAVGTDTTPSGDTVVSGYFYADPRDSAYGSASNPEAFVKIYRAASGWTNIAFNHVSVDEITVFTKAGQGDGRCQDGAISLQNRLAEHQYTISPGSTATLYTGNQEFDLAEAEASDPLFGFRGAMPTSSLIPDQVDYAAAMPRVRNQGSTGSCTAWATAYYFKTYQEVVEEGWEPDQNAFSPMYLYAMQCRYYDEPWNFIRAWEVLNRYGCARYDTLPFQDLAGACDPLEKQTYADLPISPAADAEARGYRCGERSQLAGLGQVKQALTRGPVLLGINQYNADLWSPSPENNHLTYDPANTGAGHAILCIGYDDDKFGTGALHFVNSWGRDWAIDGYSWIRYADYDDIVLFAMTIQDIPNVRQIDSTTRRPEVPTGVTASDNAGPYVDIIWSKVANAHYYRVFRSIVGDPASYREVGSTYDIRCRDFPEPGVAYYYAVVAYNDIGNSSHFASDTDAEPHVDQGMARGTALIRPVISWIANDDLQVQSRFRLEQCDRSATAMEIFVANTSEGPWTSFGWTAPQDFTITWGHDSAYLGKTPFVKVVASSSDGYSEASDPAQVGAAIASAVHVANVERIIAEPEADAIHLSWSTDDGEWDFYEIWRYLAAEDEGNEWVLIGYSETPAYTDATALPGKHYYYSIGAVRQGSYGHFQVTDSSVNIPASKANLFLYHVLYSAGELNNPAAFQLTVWNDGATTIGDYAIAISIFDWVSGEILQPFDTFHASEVAAAGQIPLPPGASHTFNFSRYLPAGYGNGHHYSWIITVDADDLIDEMYESDNTIETANVWWADLLSGSSTNLALGQIGYNYGPITNPVHFSLVVQNTGETSVRDYDIAIMAGDQTDGNTYHIATLAASTLPVSLPLQAGAEHTLHLSRTIPPEFADNHQYTWIIELDPNHLLDEISESDNRVQSYDTWWALPDTLSAFAADPPAALSKKARNHRFDAGTAGAPMAVSDRVRFLPSAAGEIPGAALTSTRPFVAADTTGSTNVRQAFGATETQTEEGYIGPIRFRKPAFCIRRHGQ